MQKIVNSIYLLKRLQRQGWIRVGVPITRSESIAEHSFATALLTMLLGLLHNMEASENDKIDIGKAVMIALVHDLPESCYMDLDHSFNDLLGSSAKKIKEKLDKKAIEILLDDLSVEKSFFEELFYPQSGRETEIVKFADKLEIFGQALEYKITGVPESSLKGFLFTIHELSTTTELEAVKYLYKLLVNRNTTRKG